MRAHTFSSATILGYSFALTFALAVSLGCARHPKPPAGPGALKVGSAVTVEQTLPLADLAGAPERFVGQTVRIEGIVSKVCQGMGCWAEVKSADGTTFLAKSLDESVLLPKDCAGRKIVVQGVVTALPATLAEEPIPEGHECPRPSYLVATAGVELY